MSWRCVASATFAAPAMDFFNPLPALCRVCCLLPQATQQAELTSLRLRHRDEMASLVAREEAVKKLIKAERRKKQPTAASGSGAAASRDAARKDKAAVVAELPSLEAEAEKYHVVDMLEHAHRKIKDGSLGGDGRQLSAAQLTTYTAVCLQRLDRKRGKPAAGAKPILLKLLPISSVTAVRGIKQEGASAATASAAQTTTTQTEIQLRCIVGRPTEERYSQMVIENDKFVSGLHAEVRCRGRRLLCAG